MIKHKLDYNFAKEQLKKDKNNSVAYFFEQKNTKQGPLSGSFFSIKSNFATQEGTSHASSNALINFQPSYNATVFEKLINAGAQPIIKVHNDELGLGGKGLYSHFGPIYNPLDSNKMVGGSSSGSAATINLADFAVASDTGDSVRRPASFVGCVGFKPSYGAVSRYGLYSYATSLDTVGWFTHNVSDTATIAQVVFGEDAKDLTSIQVPVDAIQELKPKKIGILNFNFEIEPYLVDKIEKLKQVLEKDGIEVESIEPDKKLFNAVNIVYGIISYSEATSNLSTINGITFGNAPKNESWQNILFKTRSDGFGFMLQKRLIWGSYFLEQENQDKYFLKAKKVRRLIADYYNSLLEKYDLLLFPPFYGVAPELVGDKQEKEDKITSFILTISNLTGNPSISIPLGTFDGMPFNIAADSKIYNDAKLLSFSLYLEKKIGELNE
ncbi:amidase family protein [Mesomycoplasma bovoculi]|uniref:Aspartyl/glutamyl-tRNA amidotransferase subunit A n=1 Tax=Mesomycoplasma bovoculi M165/69 TaxID=743966 RepID=W5USM9_9BACT|nr:amidase family protein [Mesomycoplasma bovoculi]AHH45111.1 aspartyl/glutamyl-tRNA amidotransferase subunit A [Mesomycoplasma bovoculi M165/69]